MKGEKRKARGEKRREKGGKEKGKGMKENRKGVKEKGKEENLDFKVKTWGGGDNLHRRICTPVC